MQHKIKIFPVGPMDILPVERLDDHVFVLKGSDADGDVWQLATLTYFTQSDVSFGASCLTSRDVSAFDKFEITSNKKRVYIDTIKVEDYVRQLGVGSEFLDIFSEEIKRTGIEAICLKAYPIVTFMFGLSPNKTPKQIKEEKKLIQRFYAKNGYSRISSRSDYMYKLI